MEQNIEKEIHRKKKENSNWKIENCKQQEKIITTWETFFYRLLIKKIRISFRLWNMKNLCTIISHSYRIILFLSIIHSVFKVIPILSLLGKSYLYKTCYVWKQFYFLDTFFIIYSLVKINNSTEKKNDLKFYISNIFKIN